MDSPLSPLTPSPPSPQCPSTLSDTEVDIFHPPKAASEGGLSTGERNSLNQSPVMISPPTTTAHSERSLSPTPYQLALRTPLPLEDGENPLSPTGSVSSELGMVTPVVQEEEDLSRARASEGPQLEPSSKSIHEPTQSSLSHDKKEETDSEADHTGVESEDDTPASPFLPSVEVSPAVEHSSGGSTPVPSKKLAPPKFTVIPPSPSETRNAGSEVDLSGLSDEETDAEAQTPRGDTRRFAALLNKHDHQDLDVFSFLEMLAEKGGNPEKGREIRPQDRFEELTTSSDRTEREAPRAQAGGEQVRSKPSQILRSRPLRGLSPFSRGPAPPLPAQREKGSKLTRPIVDARLALKKGASIPPPPPALTREHLAMRKEEDRFQDYARPSSTTSSIASYEPARFPPPRVERTPQPQPTSFAPRILRTKPLATTTRSPWIDVPSRPAPSTTTHSGEAARPARTSVSALRPSLKAARVKEDDEFSLPRPRPSLSPYELVRTIKLALDKDPVFYFTLKGVMTQFEEERAERKAALRAEREEKAPMRRKPSRTASFRKGASKVDQVALTASEEESDGGETETPSKLASVPVPVPKPVTRENDTSAAERARRATVTPAPARDPYSLPQRSEPSPFDPISESGSVAGGSDDEALLASRRFSARPRNSPPRSAPAATPSRVLAQGREDVASRLADLKLEVRAEGGYAVTHGQMATLFARSVLDRPSPSPVTATPSHGAERSHPLAAAAFSSLPTHDPKWTGSGSSPRLKKEEKHHVGRRTFRVPRRQAALYSYAAYS